MAIDGLQLELRPTASGQVGVFPEHQASLAWLRRTVRHASGRPPTILNLFAYTGLVTLALAAAGAAVVHVDAARSAVTWARRNADLSGLGAHRIRWIVDDAEAFTARERRRNRRYDGIVLDPPSWGHADGGAWRLDDRLAALLVACAGVAGPGSFCLLTTHTTGLGPASIAQLLAEAFGRPDRSVQSGELQLRAASGARLGLGAFGRIAA
jgi:23S rRNA (cytosine1962-C5)-methyltransferase